MLLDKLTLTTFATSHEVAWRILIENLLYVNAESVFEYGIGESTAIAAETNLPRYAGADSSAEWITTARSHAPDRFCFSFADVGPTREWGQPVSNNTLAKMALDYQLAPLRIEWDPFDVYFVDGRWRVACVMASFLHAIQTGGDLTKIRVLLHDYKGRGGPEGSYGAVESIATIEQKSEKAVVLAKRHGVTTADVFNTWRVSAQPKAKFIWCIWLSSYIFYLTITFYFTEISTQENLRATSKQEGYAFFESISLTWTLECKRKIL